MRRVRHHLTYANVMATIAVFLVLSGGTAVALSGSNTVQSDDLGPGAQVKAPDVAAGAVNGSNVVDNSVTGADVNESSLDATPLRTRVAQGDCQPTIAGTGAMVKVGPVCLDKYEASVWSSPTGGTQYGTTSDDYPCNGNGQDCTNIYERSVAGVKPSRFITYFQAQQALANSGKQLPTSAEWQTAVAGTPDTTTCNVATGAVENTGANTGCISRYGAYDMVGNLWEWSADWDEQSSNCSNWPSGFGSDVTCLGGDSSRLPGVLLRGGDFDDGTGAGPFAVFGLERPSGSFDNLGFRGAR
jgi:hypothetical protein